jgi:hypothetical protein
LFLTFLQFHKVHLLLLMLNGHLVLIGVLGNDLLDLGVGCDINDRLTLTVLDMDQGTVPQQKDLTDFEVAGLGSDVEWTATVYLLRQLDLGSRVLNEHVNQLKNACLGGYFQWRPVINAGNVWVHTLCVQEVLCDRDIARCACSM